MEIEVGVCVAIAVGETVAVGVAVGSCASAVVATVDALRRAMVIARIVGGIRTLISLDRMCPTTDARVSIHHPLCANRPPPTL